MAVKLNGIDLTGGAPLGSTRRSQPTASGSVVSGSSAPESADSPAPDVNITSTAELLARVQQALSSRPAVDQGRIEAISRALAEGTYRVDPERIASGLMQAERDLGTLARE
jgi:negative regulator of flagellin synthesis FlgM